MLTGRCLCGRILFEITGKLGPVIYCHCSMCRRASGSSFATNASVLTENYRILGGSDLIRGMSRLPEPTRILVLNGGRRFMEPLRISHPCGA